MKVFINNPLGLAKANIRCTIEMCKELNKLPTSFVGFLGFTNIIFFGILSTVPVLPIHRLAVEAQDNAFTGTYKYSIDYLGYDPEENNDN